MPNDIITIFKEEYPFIQELLEYKRDATLALLKGKGAMAFYEGNFSFNPSCDVKNWEEFKQFSRTYTWDFVHEGLKKYQAEEKNNEKKKFEILDMGILGPAVELIANAITDAYLERFPNWPDAGTSQEDYINLDTKGFFEKHSKQYYWLSRGKIKVKDTKYFSPKNGCPYKAQYSGKPEFQLAYFDLDKIRYYNDMARSNMPQLKEAVDKIEIKLIGQSLKNLLIDIDI